MKVGGAVQIHHGALVHSCTKLHVSVMRMSGMKTSMKMGELYASSMYDELKSVVHQLRLAVKNIGQAHNEA